MTFSGDLNLARILLIIEFIQDIPSMHEHPGFNEFCHVVLKSSCTKIHRHARPY